MKRQGQVMRHLNLRQNVPLCDDVLALLGAYAQALRQHLKSIVIARGLHNHHEYRQSNDTTHVIFNPSDNNSKPHVPLLLLLQNAGATTPAAAAAAAAAAAECKGNHLVSHELHAAEAAGAQRLQNVKVFEAAALEFLQARYGGLRRKLDVGRVG